MKKTNHFLLMFMGSFVFVMAFVLSIGFIRNLDSSYALTDGECNHMSDSLLTRIESGEEDLTYECFGAVGDGVTDDFEAIKAAHDFANKEYYSKGIFLTVHGNSSANYRINSGNQNGIFVTTDVDWHGAKFTIDDNPGVILENDLYLKPIFRVTSPMHIDASCSMLDFNRENGSAECTTKNIQSDSAVWNSLIIHKDTTNIKSFVDAIMTKTLKADSKMLKYFKDSHIWAINVTSNHLNYVRVGDNEDNGKKQTEMILIDSRTGDVLSDIEWDYDDFYQIRVWPIPEKKVTIKNAEFTTWTNNQAIAQDGSNNPYTQRGIYVAFTGNVLLQNINHYLDENKYPNTGGYQTNPKGNAYNGFIRLYNASFVEINSVRLEPHTYAENSRTAYGTYDLLYDYSNNIFINKLGYSCNKSDDSTCYTNNMVNNDKWGIIASNGSKNVFIRNSKVNRIDAHRGIHNLLVEDTVIGNKGFTLIGSGYFYGKNLTVDRANNIISLRPDYGSVWNGTMILDTVTYILNSDVVSPTIVRSNNDQSNYGYPTYFPALYVKDITIDDTTYQANKNVTLFRFNENASSSGVSKYGFKGNIRSMNVKFKGSGNHLYLFSDGFVGNNSNLSLNSYSGDNVVNIGYTNNDSSFSYTSSDTLTSKLRDATVNDKFSFTDSTSTIATVNETIVNVNKKIQEQESKSHMSEVLSNDFKLKNIHVTANSVSSNATSDGNDGYVVHVPNGTKNVAITVEGSEHVVHLVYPKSVSLAGDTTSVDITLYGIYANKKVYHLNIIVDKSTVITESISENPKTGNLFVFGVVFMVLVLSLFVFLRYSKDIKDYN